MKKEISRRRRAAIEAYEAGLKAQAENDIEQARQHFESVIAKHKSEIDIIERAQMRLGLLKRSQKFGEVEEGRSTETQIQLGVHEYNRGNPEQAKTHFEATLTDHETGARSLYNLACLAAKVDHDMGRAEELLAQAAERLPDLKDLAMRDADLVLVVQKLGWNIEEIQEV